MTPRVDLAGVNAALASRMEALARELVRTEPTTRTRTELRFRAKGSLSVIFAGPKSGSWHDHEAGVGGDPVGLVAHLRRMPMGDSLRWAAEWLGTAPSGPLREFPQRNTGCSTSIDFARRIWREASPPDAPISLLPSYLAARGLELEPGLPLRFHPCCPRSGERWPAMVALMTDPATGKGCGIHRTFLARDGSGKAPGEAKMMLGRAGVVRLVPDEDVTTGLGIAEGIETSLAVMQGFGWRPVWAATSAGAIASFPVLPGIEALTIFADADEAGMRAAEACAERWERAGREAKIIAAPRGEDFNDLSRRRVA